MTKSRLVSGAIRHLKRVTIQELYFGVACIAVGEV
jgi:hypothetical protein